MLIVVSSSFHTYSLRTVICSSFFTLHHWTKPPTSSTWFVHFYQNIYIYIYINKTQTFFVSLIVLPTKQKFIFFSWFQVQFCYFSLHPIGEDPWAKVIKFFIAQSIYNTSISIPWWTRTTILLWKGIGFSFTQKIFFFPCQKISKNN